MAWLQLYSDGFKVSPPSIPPLLYFSMIIRISSDITNVIMSSLAPLFTITTSSKASYISKTWPTSIYVLITALHFLPSGPCWFFICTYYHKYITKLLPLSHPPVLWIYLHRIKYLKDDPIIRIQGGIFVVVIGNNLSKGRKEDKRNKKGGHSSTDDIATIVGRGLWVLNSQIQVKNQEILMFY